LEKDERKKAEDQAAVTTGKMTFSDVLALYRERLKTDVNLQPRSNEYRQERTNAPLKSWPGLADKDVRQISRRDCQDWARRFGQGCSSIAFNNTIGTLRQILDIAVEAGVRYEKADCVMKAKECRISMDRAAKALGISPMRSIRADATLMLKLALPIFETGFMGRPPPSFQL
jgi:hypothetical protein